MNVFNYYYYYYSSLFAGYPFVIKIAVLIIFLLLILTVMSLFRFFYIRHKQLLEEKRKEKVDNLYKKKLITLLYFSFKEVSVTELKEDGELLKPKKGWQKRMLTDLILALKADRSFELDGGVFQNKNYYNLLTYTKLFEYWVSQMSSTSSNKAIRALRMANEIGEGIQGSVFSRSVYHRKGYLRKFARMTYTRFDAHEPYKFLEQDFDDHFNEFDKKRLHYILNEMNKEHPIPLLSKWVSNTTKESYKCFLIREMGFFRQLEGVPYLIELFESEPSLPIQCQIIETLGELKYEALIDLAMEEFPLASQELQTSIIVGVGNLKSKQTLSFLREAYQSTQFNDIKIRIVELLQEFDEDGLSILISLSEITRTEFEENLFDFALN